jgi:[NiFe] hydrogenase diaphorase moiety large subunit
MPTIVNNVETLCCVTKIMEEGPATFSAYGNEQSSGTKLLSVSGDCKKPGIYELPFGITVSDSSSSSAPKTPGGADRRPERPDRRAGRVRAEASASMTWPTGGSIIVFGPSGTCSRSRTPSWSSSSTRAAATARRVASATCC